MGNLIQTLLPAVILLLQGKIAKQVSPYPSILTLIIAGNYTHVVLYYKSAVPLLFCEFWSALMKIHMTQKSSPALGHEILL